MKKEIEAMKKKIVKKMTGDKSTLMIKALKKRAKMGYAYKTKRT